MFLNPLIGFSRLGSGFRAAIWGLPPTCATLTSTPAATHVKITGAAASAADLPCAESSGPRPRWLTTSGEEMRRKASRIELCSTSTRCGAVALSANSAANMTTAPLRSPDLATEPFLRACWRFLGVAFSVFSPAISRDPQRVEGGGDRVLELVGDPARREGQGHAEDEQADRDLGREADLEDVELRHDARDDAERGVGDDHGEHDGRRELHRRDEDAGERVLDARDHRAEGRVVDERHELVGVVQALDDPGVAVDRDEDRHADQRVELRQDRGVVARDRVDEGAEGEADQRVGQGTGGGDGGEEDGDREREGEADQQLLEGQRGEAHHVERDGVALRRERRHADGQADGRQPAHAAGDHLRAEHRRDEEQRRDAGDHEHEARGLLLGELLQERVRVHGPTICGIEAHSAVVYVSIWPSIQGPNRTMTATRAMTFGMKASVCSWICVTAWKTDTTRPTTRPAISIGTATFIATVIASIARETTTSWFISGSSPQAIG